MNAFIVLSAKRMAAALTCSLCLFAFSSASATTVLGLDIDKVVADAEFVFEGAVINSETRQDSNSASSAPMSLSKSTTSSRETTPVIR